MVMAETQTEDRKSHLSWVSPGRAKMESTRVIFTQNNVIGSIPGFFSGVVCCQISSKNCIFYALLDSVEKSRYWVLSEVLLEGINLKSLSEWPPASHTFEFNPKLSWIFAFLGRRILVVRVNWPARCFGWEASKCEALLQCLKRFIVTGTNPKKTAKPPFLLEKKKPSRKVAPGS